jgi:hypothetical protein
MTEEHRREMEEMSVRLAMLREQEPPPTAVEVLTALVDFFDLWEEILGPAGEPSACYH